TKGDSVAALAAGLVVEIGGQWRGHLHRQIEQKVLKDTYDRVIKVAEASGCRVDERAHQIYSEGFKGLGTKKDKVYAALAGLTPIQARAVEMYYEFVWPQRSLRFDISDELYDLGDQLTGSHQDADRALALLKGTHGDTKNYEDIAVQLNAAMKATAWGTGIGTDKETIFKLLRGLSAEERQAVRWAYK